MKKVVLAMLLCLVSVLPAAAAQGPYVGLGGGLSIVHESDLDITGVGSGDIEYDLGYGFNISAGYKFGPARLEAEFGFNKADTDEISGPGGSVNVDGDITVMSYMVNGFYDINMNAPVTPYVGLGLGMLDGEIELEGDEGDDTVFGYQVTAGITAPINQFLDFDVYYRYQGAGDDFEDEGVEISYDNSLVFAGIRYSFF